MSSSCMLLWVTSQKVPYLEAPNYFVIIEAIIIYNTPQLFNDCEWASLNQMMQKITGGASVRLT